MKTALIVMTLLAIGLYCVVVGMLAWRQRRFIFIPDTNPPALPIEAVPRASRITVRTEDGLDLLAWLAPAVLDAHPVVLYLHGNAGSIADRAARFAWLTSLGWGVLMLEYRGFGGNPGSPSEIGLSADARAAYAGLRERDISASRIVLWGESLGTGVAVRLATEVEVAAVLLESPYTSIAAIARRQFPFVPVDWLLLDRFDLIRRISAVQAPVLVLAGGQDDIVPPQMSRTVFATANQPKQFWWAQDAGHNDLAEAGAFDAVQAFVATHYKPAL